MLLAFLDFATLKVVTMNSWLSETNLWGFSPEVVINKRSLAKRSLIVSGLPVKMLVKLLYYCLPNSQTRVIMKCQQSSAPDNEHK